MKNQFQLHIKKNTEQNRDKVQNNFSITVQFRLTDKQSYTKCSCCERLRCQFPETTQTVRIKHGIESVVV